jgi:hypothetical protein
MNPIPPEIGQARVLEFLELNERHIPTANTKHYKDDELIQNFVGLAICQYDDDPGYYLFYCDDNWVEKADTYHDSIEDSKDQAEFEFERTINDWVKI